MLIKLSDRERREIKRQLLTWYKVSGEQLSPMVLRTFAHREFYSILRQMGYAVNQSAGSRAKKPKYSEIGMTQGARYATDEDRSRYREITDGGELGRDGYVVPVLLFDNDVITDRYEVMSYAGLTNLYEKYLGRANDFNHEFGVEQARGRLINLAIGTDPGTEMHPDLPTHALRQLSPNNPWVGNYTAFWGELAMPHIEFEDTIERVQKGLIKDVSIAFSSEELLCSECVKPMSQDMCFTWCDEHGFPGGRTEEGRLVTGVIDSVKDAFTFGMVSDGAIKRAGFVIDPGDPTQEPVRTETTGSYKIRFMPTSPSYPQSFSSALSRLN